MKQKGLATFLSYVVVTKNNQYHAQQYKNVVPISNKLSNYKSKQKKSDLTIYLFNVAFINMYMWTIPVIQ